MSFPPPDQVTFKPASELFNCGVCAVNRGIPSVCVRRAKWGKPPPPLGSASAVSLTHPIANQIAARGEQRMMGEAMLGMGCLQRWA